MSAVGGEVLPRLAQAHGIDGWLAISDGQNRRSLKCTYSSHR
jgi:hypothetical protein